MIRISRENDYDDVKITNIYYLEISSFMIINKQIKYFSPGVLHREPFPAYLARHYQEQLYHFHSH